MTDLVFYFGDWRVDRSSNSVERGDERRQMEPRMMDVLVALCRAPNKVLSAEQLLEQCWGSTAYGDSPVYKTIAQLRRLLGDNTSLPVYIETIRKRGYRTVADVRMPGRAAHAERWTTGSPFCGLRPFDADRASVFFGRADAIARLVDTVVRQVENRRALVLVLGPSGAGKTSLVRAGLLPHLRDPRAGAVPRILDSAELDLGELEDGPSCIGLALALLDWQLDGIPVFGGSSAVSLGTRLEHDSAGVVAELHAAIARHTDDARPRLVLFLDRFEAAFSHPGVAPGARERLIGALDALARSERVIVLLACRNDFYPQLAAYPALLDGKGNGAHVDMRAPTPHEIAQIIRLPALAANLSFGVDAQTQERLDDRLCLAAGDIADALPLLQYMLEELYRLRSPDGELSMDEYHRMGGLEGVIGVRAEEVYAGLAEPARAALPRVLPLLVTLSGDTGAAVGRRVPWTALQSDAEHTLVTALVEARLLVSELMGAEAGFGVAHEALLRRWMRIADWIAAHRESLHVRARVAQATARWLAEGRRSDLLLPQGKPLTEALALRGSPGLSLSADEHALIGASWRRARWRWSIRAGVVMLVVVLALVAALFGVRAALAQRVAEQKRAQAEGLMGYMLGDFADKLRPLGRLDLLDGVSARALAYLSADPDGAADAAALTHRSKALEVIGELRIARGDPAGARAALLAGRTTLHQLLQRGESNADLLALLGANAFWLGQIALDKDEWDAARTYFSEYRDHADRASALAPQNVDAWIEQSYAHNSLGTLALQRGDPRTARAEFQQSIGLKQRAIERRPDPALAADLADSLSWAGSSAEAMGSLAEAQAWYDGELRIATALHRATPGNLTWTQKAAFALQHRAGLRLARGADQDALDDYRASSALLEEVVRADPSNRQWQASLIVSRIWAIRIAVSRAATPALLEELDGLRAQIAALTALDPANAEWTRIAAVAQLRAAAVLAGLHREPQALDMAQNALRILDAVHQRNRTDVNARTVLAEAFLLHAELRQAHHLPYEQDCKSVVALLGAADDARTNPRIADPWVRAHQCLANGAAVAGTAAWLNRIGYRASAYLNSPLTRH